MIVKKLGNIDYIACYNNMKDLISSGLHGEDEFWLLEHPQVYTVGLKSKIKYNPGNAIPVIYIDRGGDITHHGPGQIIIYTIVNISRLLIGIKQYVQIIEASIISSLAKFNVKSYSSEINPGVYIDGMKIGSIGLRSSRGIVYHGLSLNYNMDLSPFNFISPCGIANLKHANFVSYNDEISRNTLEIELINQLSYAIYHRNNNARP